MKLGAVFPQTEIGADPAEIRTYVQELEAMGCDYVLAYEHVLGADPAHYPDQRFVYTQNDPFHEPLVLFGYLTALTTRLEFVTGILILPQRNAVVVAKQAAEVDVLSGGRLRLGVGVGWNTVEMEGLGYPFRSRGRRIDEQIQVMRALWTAPSVDFAGSEYFFEALGINPLPVQRPIPLWFGGGAEPVLRRIARYGAGWIPASMPAARAKSTIERLHQYLDIEHRSPDDLGIDVRINMARQPENDWPAYVEAWLNLGATHLCINTMGMGFENIDQHLGVARLFFERFGERYA